MDLGLITFADLHPGLTAEQRMRDLLEEATLADELGLKLFAVGEHHRSDYLVSSPATALAAIAAVTKQIRLSSAVTVLSSDDPVRVFEQFAHVDLISGRRAEIMAGRGCSSCAATSPIWRMTDSAPAFWFERRCHWRLCSQSASG